MRVCENCNLHFDVVWDNDGMGAPIEYCPRCGETEINEEPESENDEP